MSEEHYPFILDEEALQPERVTQLLQRQQELQDESQRVLEELNLLELLSDAGTLRHVGSSVLGLMVWRDIDLAVSSPRMSLERVFEVMQPLFIHPRVNRFRYLNESGTFNPTHLLMDERYYFGVYYNTPAGIEWKIDISFWLMQGIHPEPVHDAMKRQLTPETRLAILWIKDVWYQLPSYRNEVYSTDIYDAVLQHGVRTPGEFDRYLAQRGKPSRNH
ncbi:MAG TPA: hypothetical protein VKR42_00405 [Ktedonobacteraceae bacterium]|nr:hypothetical protein [Ktedonobacteraceae bacterium]